jgi:hypothetical protein
MIYSLYTMKSIGLDLELRQCTSHDHGVIGETRYIVHENNSVYPVRIVNCYWEKDNFYPSKYIADDGSMYDITDLYIMFTRESLPRKYK